MTVKLKLPIPREIFPANINCDFKHFPQESTPNMLATHILNSWKEISSYLGRGVRTAQRWETSFGMPVHRPAGKERSAVIAFPNELDTWLQSTKTQPAPQADTLAIQSTALERLDHLHHTQHLADKLIQQTRVLRLRCDQLSVHLKRSAELKGMRSTSRNQVGIPKQSCPPLQ